MIWAIHWEKLGGGGQGKGSRERIQVVSCDSQKSKCTEWRINLGIKDIAYKPAQADVSETLTHYKQTQHEYKHQRWSIPQISKLTFEMIFRDNYHVVTYNNSHSQTFDYQQ